MSIVITRRVNQKGFLEYIYSFLVVVTTALPEEITMAGWKVPLGGVETYDHGTPMARYVSDIYE